MIGNGFFCNRNILDATCCSRCLGKIDWLSLPEYVVLAFLYFVDIDFVLFIVSQWHGSLKFLVRIYIFEMMLLAKIRFLTDFQKFFQDLLLVLFGRKHSFPDLLLYVIGKGSGQK